MAGAPAPDPVPGLADRERMAGRHVNTRKTEPGGRYFTLSYTPRQHAPARYWQTPTQGPDPRLSGRPAVTV